MRRLVLCFMFFLPILASANHIVLHNNTKINFTVKTKERGFPIQTGSLSADQSHQFSLSDNNSNVVLIRLGDGNGKVVITRNIAGPDMQFIIQPETDPYQLSFCSPDVDGNYDCTLSG